MKKLLIISNNSGGGHRRTAELLAQTLTPHGWTVEIVGAYSDVNPDYNRFLWLNNEKIYNQWILVNERTGLLYYLFFFYVYYVIIRRNHRKFVSRALKLWQQQQPDMIISVIPLVNQIIAESLTQFERSIPFVIVQTDLFEFREALWLTLSGSWFVSDDKTYTVIGTDEAYQQVTSEFVADESRVFKLTGNLIDPRFLEPPAFDKAAERQTLDLSPERLTGIFLYGGFAPNRLFRVAQRLNDLPTEAQFIFMCGHNEALKNRLLRLETRYKKVVVGYTSEVAYYMHLADFLVGKSGPGVIMEGIAANLPLLIDTHKGITHESLNVGWVESRGFGLAFDTTAQLLERIEQLSHPAVYDPLKANVSAFDNQAVHEIPGVIEAIVRHHQQATRKPKPDAH